MTRKQRREFAKIVAAKYRHVYLEVDGVKRRVALAYSNEHELIDARGRRLKVQKDSFLGRNMVSCGAFRWSLDGENGICVVTNAALQRSLAGSAIAHNLIRGWIADCIEQKRLTHD